MKRKRIGKKKHHRSKRNKGSTSVSMIKTRSFHLKRTGKKEVPGYKLIRASGVPQPNEFGLPKKREVPDCHSNFFLKAKQALFRRLTRRRK